MTRGMHKGYKRATTQIHHWTNVKTGEWTKNLKTGEQTAKSMIEQVYAVKIPAGTTIYTGLVEYQIFLPDTRLPGIEFFKYSK